MKIPQIAEGIFNLIAPQLASLVSYVRHRDRFTSRMMAGGTLGAWLAPATIAAGLYFTGYTGVILDGLLSFGVGWSALAIYGAFVLSGLIGRGIGFYLGAESTLIDQPRNRAKTGKASLAYMVYGSSMEMSQCYIPFIADEVLPAVPEEKQQQAALALQLLDELGALKSSNPLSINSAQLFTVITVQEVYRKLDKPTSATFQLENKNYREGDLPELLITSRVEKGELEVNQLIKFFIDNNKFVNLTAVLQIYKNIVSFDRLVDDPICHSPSDFVIARLEGAKNFDLFNRTDAEAIFLQIMEDDYDPENIELWIKNAKLELKAINPEFETENNNKIIEKLSYFVDKEKNNESKQEETLIPSVLPVIPIIAKHTDLLTGKNAQKNLHKVFNFLLDANSHWRYFKKEVAMPFEAATRRGLLIGPETQQDFDFLIDILPKSNCYHMHQLFDVMIELSKSRLTTEQIKQIHNAIQKNPAHAEKIFYVTSKLIDEIPELCTQENLTLISQNTDNEIDYLADLSTAEVRDFFAEETKSLSPVASTRQQQIQWNLSIALLGRSAFELLKALHRVGFPMTRENQEMITDVPGRYFPDVMKTINILKIHGIWTKETAAEILPKLLEIEHEFAFGRVNFNTGCFLFNDIINFMKKHKFIMKINPDQNSMDTVRALYVEKFINKKSLDDLVHLKLIFTNIKLYIKNKDNLDFRRSIACEFMHVPHKDRDNVIKMFLDLNYFRSPAKDKIPLLMRSIADYVPQVLSAVNEMQKTVNRFDLDNFETLCCYPQFADRLAKDLQALKNTRISQRSLELRFTAFQGEIDAYSKVLSQFQVFDTVEITQRYLFFGQSELKEKKSNPIVQTEENSGAKLFNS